ARYADASYDSGTDARLDNLKSFEGKNEFADKVTGVRKKFWEGDADVGIPPCKENTRRRERGLLNGGSQEFWIQHCEREIAYNPQEPYQRSSRINFRNCAGV